MALGNTKDGAPSAARRTDSANGEAHRVDAVSRRAEAGPQQDLGGVRSADSQG